MRPGLGEPLLAARCPIASWLSVGLRFDLETVVLSRPFLEWMAAVSLGVGLVLDASAVLCPGGKLGSSRVAARLPRGSSGVSCVEVSSFMLPCGREEVTVMLDLSGEGLLDAWRLSSTILDLRGGEGVLSIWKLSPRSRIGLPPKIESYKGRRTTITTPTTTSLCIQSYTVD